MNDPMTLYKLMILYMLHQVNFPLTNTQITDFFLTFQITNYFKVQSAINELLEANFITKETIHNTSRYFISKDGISTLDFFENEISLSLIEDMDNYIKENKFKMRDESSITADYYKSNGPDYIVHCEVREGKSILIGLDLSVPDEKQAETMTNNWRAKSTQIYGYIIKSLSSSEKE